MAKFIIILLLGVVSWFLNDTLPEKGITIALAISVYVFIEFYVFKKVQFYKILTTGVTVITLFIMLGIFMFLFKINLDFELLADKQKYVNSAGIIIFILLGYMALFYGNSATYFKKAAGEPEKTDKYLMDTSAIIDGRVIDVCKAGFLTRDLIIPEFVIREMQLIADSSIHEKRKKGRRGLNILRKIKESDDLSINIPNVDFENLRGVDNKLLALAKKENASIISTDYNLVKVAEVEGIEVLNVNKLATILKPQHQVGEKVKVNITKKGNSKRQGVGYLDDDTMVVIDDGEKFINQSRMAVVTAYIQSETGKMLFCKLING